MAIVTRAMSVCVRLAIREYFALSQCASLAVTQAMVSAPSQESAGARLAGKEKTAQNASPSQAVRMEHVLNHLSVGVKRGLKEVSVINQTVAMDAMKKMDIVKSQENASVKLGIKASVAMSVCPIQAVSMEVVRDRGTVYVWMVGKD